MFQVRIQGCDDVKVLMTAELLVTAAINPVFFIGTAFAIHGDTDVPLQPVSHGCVRIPMDIADFFHTLVPTPGTPVYVRG
jgi:lipoprotein-anchoring transpeptidase ErfK/SrfK